MTPDTRRCTASVSSAPCGGCGEIYCADCDGYGWLYVDENDEHAGTVTCGACRGQGGYDCHCGDCLHLDHGHHHSCDARCVC